MPAGFFPLKTLFAPLPASDPEAVVGRPLPASDPEAVLGGLPPCGLLPASDPDAVLGRPLPAPFVVPAPVVKPLLVEPPPALPAFAAIGNTNAAAIVSANAPRTMMEQPKLPPLIAGPLNFRISFNRTKYQSVLPLPAPTKQTARAEGRGEESKRGWERRRRNSLEL